MTVHQHSFQVICIHALTHWSKYQNPHLLMPDLKWPIYHWIKITKTKYKTSNIRKKTV